LEYPRASNIQFNFWASSLVINSPDSVGSKSKFGIALIVSIFYTNSTNVGFVVFRASLVALGVAVPSDDCVAFDSETDLAGVLPYHLGEVQHLQ
jgi:hypothetical protein